MDSSRNDFKVFLTVVMWVVALVITFSGLAGQFVGNPIAESRQVWYVIAPLVTVVLASLIMWVAPEEAEAKLAQQAAESDRKNKRQEGDSLAMLLDLMDEDERRDFIERLKERALDNLGVNDGELPDTGETLEALLNETSRNTKNG